MKLISWNVNGVRSAIQKGLVDFLRKEKPDVLCLQETKATREQSGLEGMPWNLFWNAPPDRPGYSGTAILSKAEPLAVRSGIGIRKHDGEGRVLTAEYADFYLVNVYVPNSKRGLERLPYRTKEWDVDFLAYLKRLERSKPVVFCGDLNVAHRPIDLANPKANEKNHGFTPEERAGFDRLLEAGFVDTFRDLHPEETGRYTWWSRLNRCRERNIGWRIDYFLVSRSLRPRVRQAKIYADVEGSDHCPVGLVLA